MTGLARHASKPSTDGRVGRQVEPSLAGDVGVCVKGDVGDRVALADEELAGGELTLHPVERRVARSAPGIDLGGGRRPVETATQNLTTAMFGSWLYCSKNIHCNTFAASKRSAGR